MRTPWFAIWTISTLWGAFALAHEPEWAAPLSREEFRSLLEERVPEDRFIAEVHRRGLGFGPVLEDLDALRTAGYSLDAMLVVARSARARPASQEVAPERKVGSEEEAAPWEDEVFVALASVPQDLSACFAVPPAVRHLPQAEALEAIWAARGGVATLADASARVRMAGALAVLEFPATACALIRDISEDGEGSRGSGHADLDADSIGCLLSVLDRIGAMGLDCPLDPKTPWFHADSTALAPNVFDRFHYTVGRVLVENGMAIPLARKHLRSVRREALDFARARLLLALTEARLGRPREGIRLLSTLTGLTERGPGGVSIRDLAVLNMARIAYEQGYYEEALARYREIPTSSRVWVDATYERAWAALAGGYYAEAIGSVVALRSPLVRPRRFHDAWVVEVAALVDRCMYREAARYAKAWAEELDRRLGEYERALPGVLAFVERCAPECEDDSSDLIRADVIARVFPGLLAEPGLNSLQRTALSAVREERRIVGLATQSPALVGLDAVSHRAADLAVRDFQRALTRAVASDIRVLRLARARATDVMVDLEQEALDALLGEARALVSEGEALPVPVLIREAERMTREGYAPRDIKLFLAMNGRARAFSEDEFAALRHAGVAADVLDFARRFFGKAGPTRFEVDPGGVDPRVLWGFEGEFWTDEMLGLRVEIGDRCRSLLPTMPPGLR